jgi:hypothetical protein
VCTIDAVPELRRAIGAAQRRSPARAKIEESCALPIVRKGIAVVGIVTRVVRGPGK